RNAPRVETFDHACGLSKPRVELGDAVSGVSAVVAEVVDPPAIARAQLFSADFLQQPRAWLARGARPTRGMVAPLLDRTLHGVVDALDAVARGEEPGLTQNGRRGRRDAQPSHLQPWLQLALTLLHDVRELVRQEGASLTTLRLVLTA